MPYAKRRSPYSSRGGPMVGLALVGLAFPGCHPSSLGSSALTVSRGESVTYLRDVQPILQEKCQACHQAESLGPISLMTYEEVRAWAPLIRQRVADRSMPPWHIDRSVGIQEFANDRSLSEHEISAIVAWADQGAPRGDSRTGSSHAAAPPPETWALESQLGSPDLVIESEPYTVPDHGQDQWWRPVTKSGLERSRWLRAIEVRPVPPFGRRVTHHVIIYVHDGTTTRLLAEWAMGKQGEVMPPGTARLIPAGATIEWDVHYVPIGETAELSQVEVGLWFHPEGYDPEFRSQLESFRADAQPNAARGSQIDIPPGEVRVVRSAHRISSPARIESFQPHMHLRGMAMSLEAVYPDGRSEVLSRVDRFDPRWQLSYGFADHAMPLLPAGTDLVVTAWHDNSAANPNNPDARQWVGFGRRSVDEMAHAWISISYLDTDGYERLVGRRR
jgi:hypothetical protein